MKIYLYSLLLIFMTTLPDAKAQKTLQWSELPELPGGRGWAGMYAGVSHGALVAMGGANFPEKYPWEGGQKKWYADIYILETGHNWVKAKTMLPAAAAYGVSVSYQNKIILIGGSNENGHLGQVIQLERKGIEILQTGLPALPVPLANMSGMLMGDVIVIFGGSSSATVAPLKKCLALDMKNPDAGWFELEAWPGPERIFPVCTLYKGQGYLFGGETTGTNSKGVKFRSILLDSYRISLHKKENTWSASWEVLSPMPRGMSAGGTILPVLNNDRFLFWGGVDAVTAQFRVPAIHPGITKSVLYYFPETDSWEFIGEKTDIPSRVTLPVVFWNNQWVYVSGEVKPGIRTTSVVGVK
jgi:N-acetylneuraminate epimerase